MVLLLIAFFVALEAYEADAYPAVPWCKKECYAWKRSLGSRQVHQRADGSVLCSAASHLRWTAPFPGQNVEAARAGDRTNALPPALDFDTNNSGTHIFAAQNINWNDVYDRAIALETQLARDVNGDNATLEKNQLANDGLVEAYQAEDGIWQICNDARSIEIAIAHALVDVDVLARLSNDSCRANAVPLDPTKAYALIKRAVASNSHETNIFGTMSAGHAEKDDEIVRNDTSSGLLLVDPRRIVSSRDLEMPVWPKVFHFAKIMRSFGDSHAARADRFGHVPVRWRRSANRWSVGSRHRPSAALLAGVPFSASISSRGRKDSLARISKKS